MRHKIKLFVSPFKLVFVYIPDLYSYIIIIRWNSIGDKGVAYLFTRVKFNWNEVQYSVYATTTMCINLVGQ